MIVARIRRSWFLLRLSARGDVYFGVIELWGSYLLRLVKLWVMLLIWRALFAGGADPQGMALSQVLCYTLLSSAFENQLDVRTMASSWLHEGSILSLYQRPMGIFSQLSLHTIGAWLVPLLFFTLPVLVLFGLQGVLIPPQTGWVFLSLPLCISQGFAVDYLFACLILRARNLSWSVHSLRSALTTLLTGALIPFSALPWGLGEWLQYSPLGTLAGAPLALYVGLAEPWPLLAAQVLWNLTLWPLALWGFARSRERMVSFGG